MASKINKVNKKNSKDRSAVCAENIYFLSNNDVKTVLSKYSTLSSDDKNLVKQFSNELQLKHHNRFCNLKKFFKQAFDSDPRVRTNITRDNNVDKNESKHVNVSTTTSNKSEQKIVTDKPLTVNNSVAPNVKQESTIPPFHTNIINKINNNINNNNNIVNINPFFSTIFPMLHQKVLSQCISSKLLPQVFANNVLNLAQNVNSASVNNQTNKSVESQNESTKNPPSEFQSENSDRKCVSQTIDKKTEPNKPNSAVKLNESIKNPSSEFQSENSDGKCVSQTTDKKTKSNEPNSAVKLNETETSNKLKNIHEKKLQPVERNSINQRESNLKNNVKTNIKMEPTKNTQKSVQKFNNTIKNEPKSPSINTIKSEPKSPSINTIKKEPVTVQDLESFSMEHMKKIESFAKHNAIKFNLSPNSQIKISESNSKKKHKKPRIFNLNAIKPFFDDPDLTFETINRENIKETKNIKSSCDKSDKSNKRVIDHSTDRLKNDQKNVKPKIVNDSRDSKEKCRLYSNYDRKSAASSKSDFLNECNRLKSIISKNSSVAEKSSKKKEKVQIILTKTSKKKRKKNKNKEARKLEEKSIIEEKKEIKASEEKAISNEKTVTGENIGQVHQKKPQKREVKVVNRVLKNDSANDQMIKSISKKPFTEECNKVTNDAVLVTKEDVRCRLDKTMDTEDLMVLLKYFYKLDGVEQRRLIEFLKELELTEPERVADLRKYVRTIPPDDEDTAVVQDAQFDSVQEPTELDDRPASRNSELSNIDLILEDIDSILNDEDDEESSNNIEKSIEPEAKRLKTDFKANNVNDTSKSFGETIPVQFRNSQNHTFSFNQNLNNYSNNTPLIDYNNLFQQNINYMAQNQNYGFNHENQYFQNNFQQGYQLNEEQLFIQNQSLQNQQNRFQDFQNYCYNFNNPMQQYQQTYSNYQNEGYFQ